MKIQSNMTDPWNLKIADERVADSLQTFIIFCEDEVSEPNYFKYFETTKIKVNTIEKQKNMIDNVINAICHCKDHGIMGLIDGSECITGEEIQVWCVYDRDLEDTVEKIKKGNITFDESIRLAESKGIKVAFSNDAFELWVLLHFEEIQPTDTKYLNRKAYYDRLTEIFKILPNPNQSLSKALNHSSFNYKQDMKQRNNFIEIVRNEIVGRTNIAIGRAKILEDFHNIEGKNNHEKSPITYIHHLVEELIKFGGKKV